MKILFSYERQNPLTKLVIAIEDKKLYCYFRCTEVCETSLRFAEREDGFIEVNDGFKNELLNFIGYLIFSRQMDTKDCLKLRSVTSKYLGVEFEELDILWEKGIQYIPLLNDSKLLFSNDYVTVYSFESKAHPHNNYPIEYYVDKGIYGSYKATENEAMQLMK
jgi:hypothetical protein